jgi:tRNA(Ile)-lysidine synthase
LSTPSEAASRGAARPLAAGELAHLMAPFGPFERAPRLAVALSGGADSLALTVLLSDWAVAQGGSVVALTVDHRLRPGSTAEARRVAGLCRGLGLEHHLLTWRGPKPESNLQAAARRARYGLLAGWCARHGVLHLAAAHHRDDQAETLLLRLERGSGLDGLAAMAGLRELAGLRLLRPLLAVPKARLEATLRARGLGWIEDPSNENLLFARIRLRGLLEGQGGASSARLALAAGHLGRARSALERATSALSARCVTVDPAGFAWLTPGPLLEAEPEIALRALSRVLMVVGGADYAPRFERLERLYRRLSPRITPGSEPGAGLGLGRGATLGGCRILPRRGRILVVREAAAAPSVVLAPGQRLCWDGRYDVAVSRDLPAGAGNLRLAPLGDAGWSVLSKAVHRSLVAALPPAARRPLPALFDRWGPFEVPHLNYKRDRSQAKFMISCRFQPQNALTRVTFTVA